MKPALAEAICDTSVIQYFHQLDRLDLLPELIGTIILPPAVLEELEEGHAIGVDLPDVNTLNWIRIRVPQSAPALPLTDLGPGETQVLALAAEHPGTPVILDDARARKEAKHLQVPFTGTLGLLLNAKIAGLIERVRPDLERLQALGFRLDPSTKAHVLELAGEAPAHVS